MKNVIFVLLLLFLVGCDDTNNSPIDNAADKNIRNLIMVYSKSEGQNIKNIQIFSTDYPLVTVKAIETNNTEHYYKVSKEGSDWHITETSDVVNGNLEYRGINSPRKQENTIEEDAKRMADLTCQTIEIVYIRARTNDFSYKKQESEKMTQEMEAINNKYNKYDQVKLSDRAKEISDLQCGDIWDKIHHMAN